MRWCSAFSVASASSMVVDLLCGGVRQCSCGGWVVFVSLFVVSTALFLDCHNHIGSLCGRREVLWWCLLFCGGCVLGSFLWWRSAIFYGAFTLVPPDLRWLSIVAGIPILKHRPVFEEEDEHLTLI